MWHGIIKAGAFEWQQVSYISGSNNNLVRKRGRKPKAKDME